MGPDCFLWGSPRQNRQNPVAPEIVRSPSKATGLFFLGKYWAECEKSGRPPFGDYNIIREDECTGRSPWRSLQHCTGAPRPNGNRKTLVPGPLRSRHGRPRHLLAPLPSPEIKSNLTIRTCLIQTGPKVRFDCGFRSRQDSRSNFTRNRISLRGGLSCGAIKQGLHHFARRSPHGG